MGGEEIDRRFLFAKLVAAVDEQNMEVDIDVEASAESLNQGDRARFRVGFFQSRCPRSKTKTSCKRV